MRDSVMAMSGKATRKGALLNSGTLSPNPWDLTLSGQNVWPKLERTRAEDKPSAGMRLERGFERRMAGAAPMSGSARIQTNSAGRSLLRAQNGLDRGVHF